jgi:hypothetical protein
MKNRSIILTAILSLLGCGGLSCVAQAADPSAAKRHSAPVSVVNTPNVNVANTTTNPVPIIGTVEVAENPARQAVQTITSLGEGAHETAFPIPAGKIFVLETVSFFATGRMFFVEIDVTGPALPGTVSGPALPGGEPIPDGMVTCSYQLVLPPPSTGNFAQHAGSQALRLYAYPGTQLVIRYMAEVSVLNEANVAVSGYFVNAQ